MIFNKPKFWDKKKPDFFAILLFPFSKIVTLISNLKSGENFKNSNIKTICVGNIYVGGTGKTPLSIKINNMLNEKKFKSVVAKKFYNEQKDEQLLIKNKTNLITKGSRKDCLNEAIKQNFQIVVFDDGLQDKSISYDIKICCFSSNTWIGNGWVIPAGPLRENIYSLKKFDIVFLNGADINNEEKREQIFKINKNIKIYESNYKLKALDKFDISQNYVAFSGIGNPENFSLTLKENNFKILKSFSFPDHYDYNKRDINVIKKFADKNKAKIITTEKDYLRIKKEFRNDIRFIEMELEIHNETEFNNFILYKK